MNTTIIETTAPIPVNELKAYFSNTDISYQIDYQQSSLTGLKLLTYLSNLDLPCDIKLPDDRTAVEELLLSYFLCPFVVNVQSLEELAMQVVFEYKQLLPNPAFTDFINANESIVQRWVSVLDSLSLYNMYIIEVPEFKQWVEGFPVNDTRSTEGVNFVSLLKHPEFFSFYQHIDTTSLQFYEAYFNERMFKGLALYDFWATSSNPMFLLTFGIAEGLITSPTDILPTYQPTSGDEHVAPV
jgi:hypothetical protein